jgi:hypothetical protein
MGHGDDIRRLASKFKPEHRYPNFGPIMQSIEVRGFRGVANVTVEMRSSITALCGLNLDPPHRVLRRAGWA